MRHFSAVALATAAFAVAPAGAGAATQIGQTFVPTTDCSPGQTLLQSTSPAATPYEAPTDGVITKWSYRADNENAVGVDKLKFKVARPAPGADLTMNAAFTIIGESPLVDPVFNTLNSYSIRIPVQAGDRIGFYHDSGNSPGLDCFRLDTNYGDHFKNGDLRPPTTTTFTQEPEFQLNISAILEPDCDSDGFGDETQDPDTTSCRPCRGQTPTIQAGPGVIEGTPGRDVISGDATRNVIRSLGGKDLVCGNGGPDKLVLGNGKDKGYGGPGKDTLKGGKGKDKLKGGPGKDKQIQ